MDDLLHKIEAARINSKLRDELRDIIEDVRDYGKSARLDLETLRQAERDVAKSSIAYSEELVRFYKFLIENGLSLADVGLTSDDIPNLFGV